MTIQNISDRENLQTIEHRLKAAYHRKSSCEIGDQWRAGAMERIRTIGPLAPKVNYVEYFEQFIWRLAPVACILVLIMGTVIAHIGLLSDSHLVQIILDESENAFSLLYLTGIG